MLFFNVRVDDGTASIRCKQIATEEVMKILYDDYIFNEIHGKNSQFDVVSSTQSSLVNRDLDGEKAFEDGDVFAKDDVGRGLEETEAFNEFGDEIGISDTLEVVKECEVGKCKTTGISEEELAEIMNDIRYGL